MPSSTETFDQLEKLFKYNELPVVIMLMGLPGSGKTTFRKKFIERFPDMNFNSLSTDDFLDVRAEKLGISYDAAFHKYSGAALDNFNSQIQSFTDEKANCILDRTNTLPHKRTEHLAKFGEKYYKIGIVLETDFAECNKRVKQRCAETGKDIPESAITMMRDRFVYPSEEEFDLIISVK